MLWCPGEGLWHGNLGAPSILNFGWGPPLTQDPGFLLSPEGLDYGFQVPEVSLYLKPAFGVPGLEICGWDVPTLSTMSTRL